MYIVTWYELGFIEYEYEFNTKEEAESFYWSLREDGEIVSICDMEADYNPVL